MRLSHFGFMVAMVLGVGVAAAQQLEFKGDRLGMSLSECRVVHQRAISKTVSAPICSDTTPGPLPYAAPTIVHCRLFTDRETAAVIKKQIKAMARNSLSEPAPSYMTVGGVIPESLVYSFVDSKLYQVRVQFSSMQVAGLAQALREKYGEPSAAEVIPLQNGFGAKLEDYLTTWKIGSATIRLTERPRSQEQSDFVISHYALSKIAEQRRSHPRRPNDL